jgi:hypothetical protein
MSATETRTSLLQAQELALLTELGLADEVLASRSLLDLDDDWDDRGSPGYAASTWLRAVDLLIRVAEGLRSHHATRLATADVLPGSSGHVGLELRTDRKRLLLSVPPVPDVSVRYYGHDTAKTTTTKGTLDLTLPIGWLLAWLAE